MRVWQTFIAPILFTMIVALFQGRVTQAQDFVTVPDVTGLFPAQAAAELNRRGLQFGIEVYGSWSSATGIAPNTILAQTPAMNETAAPGSPVSVYVARTPNARLIYDGNDLTLVNQSTAPLDLSQLRFRIPGEPVPASFNASRWASTLNAGSCAQVWSVPRGSAKSLPECRSIQRWLTSTSAASHFWTPRTDTANFEVVENDVVVGTCPLATSETDILNCEMFVRPSAPIIDATSFIYVVYTTDRLAIINHASEQWMQLTDIVIYNANPNLTRTEVPLVVADLPAYGGILTTGDITKLATQQCILFMAGISEPTAPPEPCDVIARLAMDPTLIFWSVDFEVSSPSRRLRTNCPAAAPDRLSLCIVPR